MHLKEHLMTLLIKGASGELGSSVVTALGLGQLLSYRTGLRAISGPSLPP